MVGQTKEVQIKTFGFICQRAVEIYVFGFKISDWRFHSNLNNEVGTFSDLSFLTSTSTYTYLDEDIFESFYWGIGTG